MLFQSPKPKRSVAVVTPRTEGNCSPLDPFGGPENGRKWTYYHRCLGDWGRVKYVEPASWASLRDHPYVFVHEGLYDALGERTVDSLQALKQRNGRVIWVELHEKALFSGACFLPGFFEVVDLVLKHQLLDAQMLKAELGKPLNALAPHLLYGKASYAAFAEDAQLFAFSMPAGLFEAHLKFDFAAVADKIAPLMYPFSWTLAGRGTPRFSGPHPKRLAAAYAGRLHVNHIQRLTLVALLAARGVPVAYTEDYLEALRTARAFLALGHIHSSLRTFDTLAFDTLLVHYASGPYRWWDEFKPYETYIPMGDVTRIFAPGGFGVDEGYVDTVARRLTADLENDALRATVLEGQRALFEKLIDAKFIRAKLGMSE